MLDTNVLLHVVNYSAGYRKILKRLERAEKSSLVLSAITFHELNTKIIAAKAGKAKADDLAAMTAQFKIEPFNRKAALESAKLHVHLEKSGSKIGPMDTMIAGHAKALGAVMVTNNRDEFDRVSGLTVQDWTS